MLTDVDGCRRRYQWAKVRRSASSLQLLVGVQLPGAVGNPAPARPPAACTGLRVSKPGEMAAQHPLDVYLTSSCFACAGHYQDLQTKTATTYAQRGAWSVRHATCTCMAQLLPLSACAPTGASRALLQRHSTRTAEQLTHS
eukprot:289382-Chlamydomonas_euryale.AAC.5